MASKSDRLWGMGLEVYRMWTSGLIWLREVGLLGFRVLRHWALRSLNRKLSTSSSTSPTTTTTTTTPPPGRIRIYKY